MELEWGRETYFSKYHDNVIYSLDVIKVLLSSTIILILLLFSGNIVLAHWSLNGTEQGIT